MADATSQMTAPAGPVGTMAGEQAVREGAGRRAAMRGPTAWLFGRLLACVESGSLVVVLPGGKAIEHRTGIDGPQGVLVVHRRRALRSLAFGGDVGFAEAYVRGDWSSPDLTALIELVARNGSAIVERLSGWVPSRLLNRLSHLARANTRTGSRRNIAFHYDLGNDFYRLWLCRDMIYSSAIYAEPADTLERAQRRKIDAIVSALQPRPGDRVLEIGCGWGALAARLGGERAAVTAVTLSPAQLSMARAVVRQAGIADRVDLRLQDYREIEGRYDRIVSIEMIEAVGERFLPGYFHALARRLEPGGRAVIQAITIAEERFEGYRARPDFIQRSIFPGGFLPTKALMRRRLEEAGLRLVAAENFGHSYARTLHDWRTRFEAAWPEIEKLGYSASFRRLWTYYLSYCEAGFRADALDVGLYSIVHREAAS
ncbi:SAM-dependent methyltransferase [Labrys monachus]|uniref:Cyclopropane-fatty-acyl-phospholipid synthase n=1 Tax=Labrys monachus TaxID=217067 RepID=A0ABU0FMG9_9HYPH|nr:cyclopropane-fatty-acyl-phospholipid synthase family protein [Labrys monachus]MDQ0395803.1 cyclopropane-fatty-acyl-phospholipid synthase [Labrys monachus]